LLPFGFAALLHPYEQYVRRGSRGVNVFLQCGQIFSGPDVFAAMVVSFETGAGANGLT